MRKIILLVMVVIGFTTTSKGQELKEYTTTDYYKWNDTVGSLVLHENTMLTTLGMKVNEKDSTIFLDLRNLIHEYLSGVYTITDIYKGDGFSKYLTDDTPMGLVIITVNDANDNVILEYWWNYDRISMDVLLVLTEFKQ